MALTKIPSSLLDTSGGFDLQGNITLGDNEQIQLGADGDLAIYHDGSNSYIAENGTGDLYIKATNLILGESAGEQYLVAYANGSVTLYHDNNPKIATSATGATVTGNLAVTGDLDITGNVNSYNVTDLDVTDQTITLGAGQTEANSGGSGIIIDGSNASLLWNEAGNRFDLSSDLKIGAEDGGQFSLEISGGSTGTAEGGELRLNTAADYDGTYKHYRLDVYEDDFRIGRAGQTDFYIFQDGLVKAEYDFTVGGGLSVENGKLTINEFTGANAYTQIRKTNAGSNLAVVSQESIYMLLDENNDQTNRAFFIEHGAGSPGSGTTVFKVEESGNVGIGTTSPSYKADIQNSGNNIIQTTGVISGGVTAINLRQSRGSLSSPTNSSTNGDGNYIVSQIYRNGGYNSNAWIGLVTDAAADDGRIVFGTASSGTVAEKMRIDSSGNVEVRDGGSLRTYRSGNSAYAGLFMDAGEKLYIRNSWAVKDIVMLRTGEVGIGNDNPKATLNTNLQVEGSILAYMSGTSLTFDGGKNVAVTHSSSALGTGTAGGLLLANNNNSNGAPSPLIAFSARSASSSYNHTYATIHGEKTSSGADSNWNTGALIFSTSSGTGPNERMRITKDGNLLINTTSKTSFPTNAGAAAFGAGGEVNLKLSSYGAAHTYQQFILGGSVVGSISSTTSTTSYNQSSDYRLKENVVEMTGALDRVNQLQPKRFNFIADTDTTVDGFLAHEVQDIVPEAITGEKDAVDDEGNPEYQGIDHSKLVPLLTKAIQEQQAQIEALQSEINELKNS